MTSLIIIGMFLVVSLLLGVLATRGKDMNMEQWAVGGRGFGTIFVFLLVAGETFTTFTLLGGSGWAYGNGGPAYYIITYGLLANIIGYFMLPRIWAYANEKKLITQTDFFVSKYGSKKLGLLVAFVSILAMIPYLIMQLKGLGIIVSETSYGRISPEVAIWVSVTVLVAYVMLSGIHGSAWTAALKDILVLGVVVFLGIYLPVTLYGSVGEMFEGINNIKPEFLGLPSSGLSPSWFISTIVLMSIGYFMYPHAFTAIYSSKNGNAIRKNASLMPAYSLMNVFVFFVGFAAIQQLPNLTGSEIDVALFRLSAQTFDPWLVGIIGGAGLLTALVPGSMMLMAMSTLIAKNIYKEFAPNTSDKKLMIITKCLVPVIGLVAVYFTLYGANTIASLLIVGSSFISQITPAVILSLPKKPILTTKGAFSGIAVGIVFVSYMMLTGTKIGMIFTTLPQAAKDINIGLIALIMNVIVALTVSSFDKKSMAKSGSEGKVQVS